MKEQKGPLKFFKKLKPGDIKDIANSLPKDLLSNVIQNIGNKKFHKVCRLVKITHNVPDTKFKALIEDEDNSNWIRGVKFHPSGEYLATAKWNKMYDLLQQPT